MEGVATIVFVKTHSSSHGTNDCTCLIDAIMALAPLSISLYHQLVSSMPVEGNTMIKDVSPALARQCFKLISVGGSYHKKNGAPFHLLQEYQCQIVINIILVNLKQQTMYHFIVWDDSHLYDQGYVSIVNTRDRSNEEESSKVILAQNKMLLIFPKS